MAELVNPPAVGRSFGETQRRDAWWVEIIPVVVLLGAFGLYATLRAFEGRFCDWGPYLSPFYSPLIDPHHHWWPFSPALLILGGPLGFRVTCYYYRKAYYRAFFLDPPACTVTESRNTYRGETAFPPMEVGPTCHYMMGGIRVDAETAQSSLPGLFAAGEAAAGLYGANRLGGNSLSDLLVFGRRAGLAAAHHASTTSASVVDSAEIDQAEHDALAPFQQKVGESPYAIHRDLQDSMQKLVGIFRNREDLERSLGEIEKAKKRLGRVSVEGSRLYNPGWQLALDLKSMLTVSEAVALSALAREESRGAHSRIDFQKLDPAWEAKNNIIQRDVEAMRLRQEHVPEMPGELRSLLAEEKGETARRA